MCLSCFCFLTGDGGLRVVKGWLNGSVVLYLLIMRGGVGGGGREGRGGSGRGGGGGGGDDRRRGEESGGGCYCTYLHLGMSVGDFPSLDQCVWDWKVCVCAFSLISSSYVFSTRQPVRVWWDPVVLCPPQHEALPGAPQAGVRRPTIPGPNGSSDAYLGPQ